MDITSILVSIVTSSIISGIFTFIIQKSYESRLNKNLETHKAMLQTELQTRIESHKATLQTELQTRIESHKATLQTEIENYKAQIQKNNFVFQKYYEKRLESTSKICGLLNEVKVSSEKYTRLFRSTGSSPQSEDFQELKTKTENLRDYIKVNFLWLEDSDHDKIENTIEKLILKTNDYGISLGSRNARETFDITKEISQINDEIKEISRKIRNTIKG